jgi:hypothetical protein
VTFMALFGNHKPLRPANPYDFTIMLAKLPLQQH